MSVALEGSEGSEEPVELEELVAPVELAAPVESVV